MPCSRVFYRRPPDLNKRKDLSRPAAMSQQSLSAASGWARAHRGAFTPGATISSTVNKASMSAAVRPLLGMSCRQSAGTRAPHSRPRPRHRLMPTLLLQPCMRDRWSTALWPLLVGPLLDALKRAYNLLQALLLRETTHAFNRYSQWTSGGTYNAAHHAHSRRCR
jgi:hypothetical protein